MQLTIGALVGEAGGGARRRQGWPNPADPLREKIGSQ